MNELRPDFAAATHKPGDEKIGHYLLIEHTRLARADAIIVCGNSHAYGKLASMAAALYNKALSPKIVVSGGRKGSANASEADILHARLLQLDVPSHVIRLEDQATNTPENIRFSRTLLEAESKRPVTSAILVGSVVAGRRFLMTAAKEWPELFAMAANVNPFPFPIRYWPEQPERSIIEKEYEKIQRYLAKGDIAEVDIPAINRRALALAEQQDLSI